MGTTNETTRDSFVVYRSMLESAMMYDGIDQTELLAAIFKYGLDGEEPVFTNRYVMATWLSMKPNIDNACKKRDAKVAAGSKGGTISKKPSIKKVEEAPKEEPKVLLIESEELIPESKEEALESIFGAQRSIIEEIEEIEEESFLESLEEYGDDEDEDEVKNYSTVTVILNNQNLVSVPTEMVEYFNEIPNRRLIELKKTTGQFDFEFTLKNLYQSWKTNKEIMSQMNRLNQ
jgi:hypothetical protein